MTVTLRIIACLLQAIWLGEYFKQAVSIIDYSYPVLMIFFSLQVHLHCSFFGDFIGIATSESKFLCNDLYSQGTHVFYNTSDQVTLRPLRYVYFS